MTFFRTALLLTVAAFLCIGCLNVERKQYRYKFNPDGTGSGSIKYINIHSDGGEDSTAIQDDFNTLINDHLNGTQFNTDNPGLSAKEKRLFVEDSVLCGEVTFVFASAADLGFYFNEKCACCPLLFTPAAFGETVEETNGTMIRAGENIAYIEWPSGTTEVSFQTLVTEASETSVSLLSMWTDYESKK